MAIFAKTTWQFTKASLAIHLASGHWRFVGLLGTEVGAATLEACRRGRPRKRRSGVGWFGGRLSEFGMVFGVEAAVAFWIQIYLFIGMLLWVGGCLMNSGETNKLVAFNVVEATIYRMESYKLLGKRPTTDEAAYPLCNTRTLTQLKCHLIWVVDSIRVSCVKHAFWKATIYVLFETLINYTYLRLYLIRLRLVDLFIGNGWNHHAAFF